MNKKMYIVIPFHNYEEFYHIQQNIILNNPVSSLPLIKDIAQICLTIGVENCIGWFEYMRN